MHNKTGKKEQVIKIPNQMKKQQMVLTDEMSDNENGTKETYKNIGILLRENDCADKVIISML